MGGFCTEMVCKGTSGVFRGVFLCCLRLLIKNKRSSRRRMAARPPTIPPMIAPIAELLLELDWFVFMENKRR